MRYASGIFCRQYLSAYLFKWHCRSHAARPLVAWTFRYATNRNGVVTLPKSADEEKVFHQCCLLSVSAFSVRNLWRCYLFIRLESESKWPAALAACRVRAKSCGANKTRKSMGRGTEKSSAVRRYRKGRRQGLMECLQDKGCGTISIKHR